MNIQAMTETRDKYIAQFTESNGEKYAKFIGEVAHTLAYGDEIYSTLGMLGAAGDNATEAMRNLVSRCIATLAALASIDNAEIKTALDDTRRMMKAVDAAAETPTISMLQ